MRETSNDVAQRRERGELTPLEALLLAKATPTALESPELLQRVAALASALEELHVRGGGAGAALWVLREAQGCELAPVDRDKLIQELSRDWAGVTALAVAEAAGLSLAALGEQGQRGGIEEALARWVQHRLPEASAREALALFARRAHAEPWWREAVQRGVAQASEARSPSWAQSVWRWWGEEPHRAAELLCSIEHDAENEAWLLDHPSHEVAPEALAPLLAECRARRWPVLVARLVCTYGALAERIKQMRPFGRTCPQRAVELILDGADDAAVIEEAQHSDWEPLIWASARRTRKTPELFARLTNPKGAARLVVAHERLGGASADQVLSERVRGHREYHDSREAASKALELKVLFLGASPKGEMRVDYDVEARGIAEGVRQAKHRGLVNVILELAVSREDLQALLLKHEPHVVHFAGHAHETAILLQTTSGEKAPVSARAFADLMRICSDHVQVVVLNGCFTDEQAKKISRYVDYAIGMNDEIAREPAQLFAASFYSALASGTSLEKAFALAKNAPELHDWLNTVGDPAQYLRYGFDSAEPLVCFGS